MTATTIPAPVELPMTANLAGKTPAELKQMFDELDFQTWNLYVSYNQNFFISKSYDAAYLRERQAILDQLKPIQEALEPVYLEECATNRETLVAAA